MTKQYDISQVKVGSEWINGDGKTVKVTRVTTALTGEGVWVEGHKTGFCPRTFLNSHRPA